MNRTDVVSCMIPVIPTFADDKTTSFFFFYSDFFICSTSPWHPLQLPPQPEHPAQPPFFRSRIVARTENETITINMINMIAVAAFMLSPSLFLFYILYQTEDSNTRQIQKNQIQYHVSHRHCRFYSTHILSFQTPATDRLALTAFPLYGSFRNNRYKTPARRSIAATVDAPNVRAPVATPLI